MKTKEKQKKYNPMAAYDTSAVRYENEEGIIVYSYEDPAGEPCLRTWYVVNMDPVDFAELDLNHMKLPRDGVQCAFSVYLDNTFSLYVFGKPDQDGNAQMLSFSVNTTPGQIVVHTLRSAYPDADAFFAKYFDKMDVPDNKLPMSAKEIMKSRESRIILKNVWNDDGDGFTAMNGTKYDVAWKAEQIPAHVEGSMRFGHFTLNPYGEDEKSVEAYVCFTFAGRVDMFRQSEEYGRGFGLSKNVTPDSRYFEIFSQLDGRFKAFAGKAYVIHELEKILGPVFGEDAESKPMQVSKFEQMKHMAAKS